MTRINTNVQSLISQRVLGLNNRDLSQALERLSTGLRINRGADDPAGLIASENLRAEKTGLDSAISNAERTEQVVNIAEGGLTEVSSLLNELEGLVTATANTAGLSEAEREANQLQVDSILQTIDRVAQATSFQGLSLLNGNLDYVTSGVSTEVSQFRVDGAKLGFGETRDVDIVVTNSAQVGGFLLSFGGANLDLGAATDQFVLEIAGALGSRELSFASGAALTDIASQINTFSDVTGVSATASGTGLRLDSTGVGSDQFVTVKVVEEGGLTAAVGGAVGVYNFLATDSAGADPNSGGAGTPLATYDSTAAENGVTDAGQDVQGTINGIVGVSRGSELSINTDFLNVTVDLALGTPSTPGEANAQTLGLVNALTITGGGADFQLASEVNIAGKVSLGIGNVASRELGRTLAQVSGSLQAFTLADLSGGRDLNLEDGDTTLAQRVVGEAIKEVSSLRGRLGAFQSNVVGATIRSLGVAFENTTAAESAIRDADFAFETAQLTRAQILVQSNVNTLGIANSQPQNVLSLLG